MTDKLYNSPCRLFLIINESEYLIREPLGWDTAKMSLKRTENHGFSYNFPDSSTTLKFHNRKITGTDYQKAKDLLDDAYLTYGADMEAQLRFEYFDDDEWKKLDTIELVKYSKDDNDSSMRSDGKIKEKEFKDLLSASINLYDDVDYTNNPIKRIDPVDLWFHSKIIRVISDGNWFNPNLDDVFNAVIGEFGSGEYMSAFPSNFVTDEITLNGSFSQSYVESPPIYMDVEYDGVYDFDIRLLAADGFILPNRPAESVQTLEAYIYIDGEPYVEIDKAIGTSFLQLTGATFTYKDKITLFRGQKVSITFRDVNSSKFHFSRSFAIDGELLPASYIKIVADTQVDGKYEKSFNLLESLQKAYQILTGSSLSSSDFFKNNYPNIYLTSGRILKGGELNKDNAPVFSMDEMISSIDAIFNIGYNFEETTDIKKSNISLISFQEELISGDISGSGEITSINSSEIFSIRRPYPFVVGEVITGLTSGASASIIESVFTLVTGGDPFLGSTVTGTISGATAQIVTSSKLLATSYTVLVNIVGKFSSGEPIIDDLSAIRNESDNFQQITLGKIEVGDSVTGGLSGATGLVLVSGEGGGISGYSMEIEVLSGDFDEGEVISSSISGTINTISTSKGASLVVEESAHFYNQENQIIDLSDRPIYNLKESTADDYIYNEAIFSYPELRYDELNTVDESNTKASYLLSSRKIKNKYQKESPFKTSPYDIEFLRRQALDSETTAFKEDVDIFLVQGSDNLFIDNINVSSQSFADNTRQITVQNGIEYKEFFKKGFGFKLEGHSPQPHDGTYTIDQGNPFSESSGDLIVKVNEVIPSTVGSPVSKITLTSLVCESNELFQDMDNVISPETTYNAKLTPARNKMRHDVWLNASQHFKSPSETVINTNYDYNGELTTRLREPDDYYDPDRIYLKQNKDFRLTSSNRFNHWVIPIKSEFTVKLSFTEWLSIKDSCFGGDNKYGYITHKNWKGDVIDSWVLMIEGSPDDNYFTFETLWFRINGESPIPPQDFWTDENLNNILTKDGGEEISWS
jgi:hypothetical protein